jgi:hypothetical protein
MVPTRAVAGRALADGSRVAASAGCRPASEWMSRWRYKAWSVQDTQLPPVRLPAAGACSKAGRSQLDDAHRWLNGRPT